MAASRKGRALRGDHAVNLVELDLTQLELGNVEARTGPRLQTFASSTIPADVALMKQLRHAASWTG